MSVMTKRKPAHKAVSGMIGAEKKIGHRIPNDCIKEEEARELKEFSQSGASKKEKAARIKALMDRAGNCPLCRRALLKVFDT